MGAHVCTAASFCFSSAPPCHRTTATCITFCSSLCSLCSLGCASVRTGGLSTAGGWALPVHEGLKVLGPHAWQPAQAWAQTLASTGASSSRPSGQVTNVLFTRTIGRAEWPEEQHRSRDKAHAARGYAQLRNRHSKPMHGAKRQACRASSPTRPHKAHSEDGEPAKPGRKV